MTASLRFLFEQYFKEPAHTVSELPGHASARKLYRILGSKNSCIGVAFDQQAENKAFLSFSQAFKKLGLPVPDIFCVAADGCSYLEQDLGDVTLYDMLQADRATGQNFSNRVREYYRQSLSWLVKFQVLGRSAIDYSLCYQGDIFDKAAMLKDFALYRSDFLERSKVKFDVTAFEQESQRFCDFLAAADTNYFLYRDFQARNIMVHNNNLYFIDYQTGRRGAPQWDVVSLLYQSQAGIPESDRQNLIHDYLADLKAAGGMTAQDFMKHFYGFVVLRLLQVLATYGREGLGNQKKYFLDGIPVALNLLAQVAADHRALVDFPELHRLSCLRKV